MRKSLIKRIKSIFDAQKNTDSEIKVSVERDNMSESNTRPDYPGPGYLRGAEVRPADLQGTELPTLYAHGIKMYRIGDRETINIEMEDEDNV